jgi:hypothetical protein
VDQIHSLAARRGGSDFPSAGLASIHLARRCESRPSPSPNQRIGHRSGFDSDVPSDAARHLSCRIEI